MTVYTRIPHILFYLAWLLPLTLFVGCESGLDPEPSQAIESETAITDLASLEAATVGIYDAMQSEFYYGRLYAAWPDLAADNVAAGFGAQSPTTRELDALAITDVQASSLELFEMWRAIYEAINRANNVLEGTQRLRANGILTPEEAARYEGEARTLRALFHHDLVRFFANPYNTSAFFNPGTQGVPVIVQSTQTLNEAENTNAPATVGEVYATIENELLAADSLLLVAGQAGQFANTNTSRVTDVVPLALLARVSLYQQRYEDAFFYTSLLIGEQPDPSFDLVDNFSNLYSREFNLESVFEVDFRPDDVNNVSDFYRLQFQGGRQAYVVEMDLYGTYQLEDLRATPDIIEPPFYVDDTVLFDPPGVRKYFNRDANFYIIRKAELYLIAAEALAQLGDEAGALDFLNPLRVRAGLEPITNPSEDLLDIIARERRLELAFEGHRWFDLVRTGRAETVLGVPQSRWALPIPEEAINRNPLLR